MEALPLIRYRTGDYTRILPSPCPCGSEVIRIDRLQRDGEEGLLSRLDDAMFRLPELADYRIARGSAGFTVHALTVCEARLELERILKEFFPGEEFRITAVPAADTDRALTPGKRRILPPS